MIFFIFQARRNKTRKATVISILQQRRKKKWCHRNTNCENACRAKQRIIKVMYSTPWSVDIGKWIKTRRRDCPSIPLPGKTIPGRESNNEGTLGRCFLLKPATRGNNFVSPYIFEVPIIPPHRKEAGFNFTQFETGELD